MRSRVNAVCLIVLAAVLFAAPALTKDLWTPDEPRYALVAREMLLAGDWVVLHRNDEVYREKPPLLFWAIAAFSAPLGDVDEITARLPSIFAALIALLLTYDLARRMFGARTGLWSAVILATTFRFWWQSNTGQIDMLLTACLTLSIYALWRWHESRRARWPVLYHVGAALGLLAKGPPALVFTLSSAVGFYWGRPGERRGMRLWLGLPLSIVPVGAWFYFARQHGAGDVGDEVSGTVARQIVGRIFSGVSHAQPPWYYIVRLPSEWFPWILIFPWTLVYTWRARREGAAMRLLLASILPALVFFHLIVEKRTVYLVPIYPATAVLVARSLIALLDEGRYGWLRAVAALWVPMLAGAGAAPYFVQHTPAEQGAHPIMYLLTVVAALCMVWTFAIYGTGAWRHWPAAMAAQTAALLLAVGIGVFPVVNVHKSSKDFCAPVRELVRAGDVEVLTVRLLREELVFYSHAAHRVVLQYPGISAFGGPGSAAAIEQARTIRYDMVNVCTDLPLTDFVAPPAEEIQAFRGEINRLLSDRGLSRDLQQQYHAAVTHDIDSALSPLRSDSPVVIFATNGDWRWLLAFSSPLPSGMKVLQGRQVSSRDMLLLGNSAAVDVLRGLDALGVN